MSRMMMKMLSAAFVSVFAVVTVLASANVCLAPPVSVNHNHTNINNLADADINRAKALLHIGYGHTSHGSQITTGMAGLDAFMGGTGLYAVNNGGTGGALDLEEGAGYGSGWLERDCGYWPTWYDETREYLDDASHSDVNVIMWSWCGQVAGRYSGGTMASLYLNPMTSLETQYPNVMFVYMTGHLDHGNDANLKAGNQQIRDYCTANNKILYDYADIESYDPDGTYFEFADDSCDYYASASGAKLGNWAIEWQNSHLKYPDHYPADWYQCGSSHSQPLNANRKAYAAWALWSELSAMLATPGDCQGNGMIDGADLAAWQANYDPLGNNYNTFGKGDWNGDGFIDGADLALWQQNYDPLGPPGVPAAAPEPATLLLVGLGALLLRRRRQ